VGAKVRKEHDSICGISSGDNATLDEFNAIMTMDNSDYPIRIRVISLRYAHETVAHWCRFSKYYSDYNECWKNCYPIIAKNLHK
jgi:hypothetical protein